VFGTAYDKDFIPVTTYTETLEGLERFKGSKYVQSVVGDSTFKQMKEFLTEGRFVLYIGTPCQIAAARNFLKKDYANFVTVDLICHGVTPTSYFKEEIDFFVKGYTNGDITDYQAAALIMAIYINGMNDEELFPQLIITENYNIILEGEQQVEIEMEPLIKTVYLLFLSHPEGILLKCLSDYRAELTNIYLLLKPHGMSDRVKRSIMDVTDPTLNSINEKCARIRKIISGILPPNTARYYAISGKRGEVKKIGVARNNVVWRCNLCNHKPCD